MKRVLILCSFILLMTLFSCMKEYECVCVTEAVIGNDTVKSTNINSISEFDRVKASQECRSQSSTTVKGGNKVTVNCALDSL